MSDIDRSRTERPVQPAGAAGDGMDPYPTYHDRPASHGTAGATGAKPTDVGLPRSRRTYALPILIGLLVFAAVIIIRIVWGGMNMAATDISEPGDPASPVAAPAAAGATPAAGIDVPESDLGANRDAQAQPATGPGEIEATPGPADVPGGATTSPVEPGTLPAQ